MIFAITTPTSASVTTPGSLYGKTSGSKKKSQTRDVAEDGTVRTYTRNATASLVGISVNCTLAKKIELFTFFTTNTNMSQYPFSFTPDANMDAGAGAGVAVIAYLWQDDLTENYVQGRFEINMTLKIVQTPA